MYRPRLYHLKSEKELFEYFSSHAGFIQDGLYECAGIIACDTSELFKKLKKEWKKDIVDKAKIILED